MLHIDSIKNFMTNNITKNIEWIESNHGAKFKLESESISMPIIITRQKSVTIDLEYYVIQYDTDNNKNEIPLPYILPFSIWFYDPVINETNNNNVYIANISRTFDIRGSDVVKFVLNFLKILGAEKAYLHDGTSVECSDGSKIDLSLYKLMEKSLPYYMNFGFEFYINPGGSNNLRPHFKSDEILHKVLKKTLETIRNLQIDDLINTYCQLIDVCSDSIKKGDANEIIVRRFVTPAEVPAFIYIQKYPSDPITYLWRANTILGIFYKSKAKDFRELIVELVSSGNCNTYDQLISVMFEEPIYSYQYHNIVIPTEYVRTYALLQMIRWNTAYVYDFRKDKIKIDLNIT